MIRRKECQMSLSRVLEEVALFSYIALNLMTLAWNLMLQSKMSSASVRIVLNLKNRNAVTCCCQTSNEESIMQDVASLSSWIEVTGCIFKCLSPEVAPLRCAAKIEGGCQM